MPEGKLRMTIVNDSSQKVCEADCIDWSKAETLVEAKLKVLQTFGDRAELDYVDLPKSKNNLLVKRMRQATEGMPLPVLMANGKPRIAGQFDLRQLLDIIETELEAEI